MQIVTLAKGTILCEDCPPKGLNVAMHFFFFLTYLSAWTSTSCKAQEPEDIPNQIIPHKELLPALLDLLGNSFSRTVVSYTTK